MPRSACAARLRVGAVPREALSLVRRKLADLFRGRPSGSDDQRQSDLDPEYEYWIGLVERSRGLLQYRADRAPVELGEVIPLANWHPSSRRNCNRTGLMRSRRNPGARTWSVSASY